MCKLSCAHGVCGILSARVTKWSQVSDKILNGEQGYDPVERAGVQGSRGRDSGAKGLRGQGTQGPSDSWAQGPFDSGAQ